MADLLVRHPRRVAGHCYPRWLPGGHKMKYLAGALWLYLSLHLLCLILVILHLPTLQASTPYSRTVLD